MRILKLIIISFISLSLIITIISLFIPSNVTISRAVQINVSKEEVMRQLNEPANWRHWYPGGDSTDFFYENAVVKGLVLDKRRHHYIIMLAEKKQEVMAIFRLSRKNISTGWRLVPATDSKSVTVQWYINFHLRWYPWEKFSSFMFERISDPQLKQGLDNLKALLEK